MQDFQDGKPRVLPDMDICRAEDIDLEGYAKCLVDSPLECQYALSFGHGCLCTHPNREAIIQKRESEESK